MSTIQKQLKKNGILKAQLVPKRHLQIPFSTLPIPANMDEVVSWLPIAAVSEILFDRFMTHVDDLFHISFRPVCREFFKFTFSDRRRSLPLTWYALLFSIFSIASHTYLEDEPEFQAVRVAFPAQKNVTGVFQLLHSYAEKCLTASQFMKRGSPLALVTLIILSLVDDSDSFQWTMMGFIIQLAKLMGNNRDPDLFSDKITETSKELRRRIFGWVLVVDGDLSMNIGCSTGFSIGSFDSGAPKNLDDLDLMMSATSGVLSSKAPDEITDNSYLLQTLRLSRLQRRLFDDSQVDINLDSIMAKDRLLKDFEHSIPNIYRPQPPGLNDSPAIVAHRFLLSITLNNLYNRLHQISSVKVGKDDRYASSANLFEQSCRKLLEIQLEVDRHYDLIHIFRWYFDLKMVDLGVNIVFIARKLFMDPYGPTTQADLALIRKSHEICNRRCLHVRAGTKIVLAGQKLVEKVDDFFLARAQSNPMTTSSSEVSESPLPTGLIAPQWNDSMMNDEIFDILFQDQSDMSHESDSVVEDLFAALPELDAAAHVPDWMVS